MRPPGFHQPTQQNNNQNRFQGNNLNQNRPPNQGAIYQNHPPQNPNFQAPPQQNTVTVTDVRANANATLSSSQSNSFDLQQIAAALEDKLDIRMNQFEKSLNEIKNSIFTPTAPLKAVTENLYNKPSTSSSSLPNNTIPNPKGEAKAITTKSGMSYKEPPILPTGVNQQEPVEVTTDTEPQNSDDIHPPTVQAEVQIDKPAKEPVLVIPKAKTNFLTLLDFRKKNFERRMTYLQLSLWKSSEIYTSSSVLPTHLYTCQNFVADPRVPLILGRPFLSTAHALIDVYEGDILILEALLNNDPEPLSNQKDFFPTLHKDLKVVEPKTQSEEDEPPKVKLKELPPHLDPWVSPIHCVPKKGGMTVIKNDVNELIPTRLEFNFKVIDTRGVKNYAADHLSRLENPYENVFDPKEINETFPLESLNKVAHKDPTEEIFFQRYSTLLLESSSSKSQDDCNTDVPESSGNTNPTATSTFPLANQVETLTVESPIPTASSPVPTACFTDSQEPSNVLGVTTNSKESNGVEADVSNMETTITASPTPTLRIYRDHPKSQIIGPVDTPIQTRNKFKAVREQGFIATIHQKTDPALLQFCLFSCFLSQVEPKKIFDALQDLGWVEAMQEELFKYKIQKVWTLVDCPKGAPKAWYGTLSKYLLTNGFQRVKRIFRYLKVHPKLGLWYPKDSPFDLVAYSDSGYGGATQDRKSTTRGCQFLGRRLISWQCKKQRIIATSTTEAEYVAAASCCG
nr:putative ribonuclease H-like domain-containing protein [Tanacetum cinerariifolium]